MNNGPTLTNLQELIERLEKALKKLPGNNYEFTQPIQMRFNELIAGVRSDVAVKVYGDTFDDMVKTANTIAEVIRKVQGAADVKVEQTQGAPTIEVETDRAAISRYGLSMADVHDAVAIAVGGREAGLVFEGDRRFDIIVRLPESLRNDVEAFETLPIPLPQAQGGRALLTTLSGNPGPKEPQEKGIGKTILHSSQSGGPDTCSRRSERGQP